MIKTKICFLSVVLLAAQFIGCADHDDQNSCENIIDASKVSVNWNDTESSKKINSYEANVSEYYKNSRTDTDFKLQQKYHVSVKQIDDLRYVRMDTIPLNDKDYMYSTIANENEGIMIDTASGDTLSSIPLRIKEIEADFDFNCFNDNLLLAGVDIDSVKDDCERLAFECTENKEESRLVVNIPSSVINIENRVSSKMSFDTISNTLSEIEYIENDSDGATVTTKINFSYKESNEMYINIGSVTVIERKYPIEQASETETIVEFYEDLSLNKVDDDIFRPLLK